MSDQVIDLMKYKAETNSRFIELESELRNGYIRKDDLDFKRVIETQQKHGEDITDLKSQLKNINTNLDKNNLMTENLNTKASKSDSSIERIDEKLKEFKEDHKESMNEVKTTLNLMSDKINNINIDTSKNNDSRIGGKQIVMFILTSLISIFLGGIIMVDKF